MSIRLEVRGLSRRFGMRQVVSEATLEVGAGQVACLLGPSGCGKSTTLRMIAGIERPDQGEVRIEGRPVFAPGVDVPAEGRSVGLMFQDFALFPHLSVGGNVGFGLQRLSAADRERRVAEMLERVGLLAHLEKFPHQLSGGEQQRVALARALAAKPKVMLMDEPFSGLDNRLRDGVREATLDLLRQSGTAVLLVTHDPDEAMRTADVIALMRDGRIVQQGAPFTVYNAPVDREAAAFFSDVNVLRAVVKGAIATTAFGEFLTPGHPDGTVIDIVIRPQHLKIDFDRGGKGPNPTVQDGVPARGTVARARFLGRESLVDFKMDFDGSILTSSVPGVFLPRAGTPLWLMMRRDRCHVFPARDQTVA